MMKEFFAQWVPQVDKTIEEFFKSKEKIPKRYREINEMAFDFMKGFTLSPGKRVRPVLVLAGYLSQREKVPKDILRVASAVEMFHAFLLIHDDFMDEDSFRRGEPTVWKRFENSGVDRHTAYSLAVTTGDILYTYVFQQILSTKLPEERKLAVLDRVLETMELTGFGQNIDVYNAVRPIPEVRKEDILLMYELKTGVYTISFPLILGAELAGAPKKVIRAFNEYGRKVGTAFQIHDDILGIFGDPSKTRKPVGSDIREGKRTILILEAYQSASPQERKIIERYLGKDDEEGIKRVIEIVEKTGALERAKEMERNLVEEGINAIEDIPIRDDIRTFLVELAHYLITREK